MTGSICVLAEQWRGRISETTYEALALGREVAGELGVPLTAILTGWNVKDLALTLGLPLVAGFRTAPTRAIAQIEGSAFRVEGETLTAVLRQCPKLERRLQQFAQVMAMQTTQIAACNRLHEVNERLARWLLMSADRIGSNSVPLTQELIAQMLGTRRSSVTVAAGTLQKAGLITYTRGDVKIIDRQKLEEAACECYEIMQRQIEEWQSEAE